MLNVLEEISQWKLDAKQEDPSRYFFHMNFVERLINGQKSFVIGRKGTGKTAIGKYIESINKYDIFTKKLTFKNFPFNDLYSLENKRFPSSNQYITLWKYLIYTTIAKQMMKNEKIDYGIRQKLESVYSSDPEISLSRSISRWVSAKFSLNILSNGGSLEASKEYSENNTSWIDRVEVLEDLIYQYCDDSNYLIVFDELDEDYTDILQEDKYKEYTNLIKGLFKAIQDVKSIFSNNKFKINPIVFLRDDIYNILQDPDKNKWDDSLIWIEWNKTEIQNLIAFRISRAISPTGELLSFKHAWEKIFYREFVYVGDRQSKGITQFEYILKNTMLRPRDFVKYLQQCAEDALNNHKTLIRSNAIKYASRGFSNYLRKELEDEMHSIIPDISKVFDVFSHIRKQTLSIEQFRTVYMEEYKQNFVKNNDVDFILTKLFTFSVIGNQPNQHNTQIFQYQNKDATFNFKENIIVHRGLYKSLQIV